jgi:glycyl-tRNA synthetase (class II)
LKSGTAAGTAAARGFAISNFRFEIQGRTGVFREQEFEISDLRFQIPKNKHVTNHQPKGSL